METVSYLHMCTCILYIVVVHKCLIHFCLYHTLLQAVLGCPCMLGLITMCMYVSLSGTTMDFFVVLCNLTFLSRLDYCLRCRVKFTLLLIYLTRREFPYSPPQTNTSYAESVIFWAALIVSPVLWILCFFTALIGIKWTWGVSDLRVLIKLL